MITYCGNQVVPGGSGGPSETDLAVAMCRITRYAGALWCPLAVHSILVAEFAFLARNDDLLWVHALLHDAHECVTGEVTGYWKPREMKEAERDLDARILAHLRLSAERHREYAAPIKEADQKALCAEATTLGLPGWVDFHREQSGSEAPTLSPTERAVAETLLGGFWRRCEMVDAESRQVAVLQEVFQKIRDGAYADARRLVSPACHPLEG